MIRGTTAYFKFIMPYDYNQLASATVRFWQPGNNGPSSDRPLPIIKTLAQCAPTNVNNELSISLNSEETRRFSDKRKGCVQMSATLVEGGRFACLEQLFTVYPLYGDDVGDEGIQPTPDSNGLIILDGGNI